MRRFLTLLAVLVAAYAGLIIGAILAYDAVPAHGELVRQQQIAELQQHDPSSIVLLGPSSSS